MTHTKTDGNLPQRLADEFSRLVRDSLTFDQMSDVLRRNRTYVAGVCATHDFLDANIQMAQAFELITGRQSEPASDVDAALWSAAWALAKNAEFPRKLELIENAEGIPVFAYAIRDMWIDNPALSECTRFPADPTSYYGLRAEEIAALENANSLLVAERLLRDQAMHVSETHADQVHAAAARPAGLLAAVSRFLAPLGRRNRTVSSISDVRALYPSLEEWHSGGGCFALRHDCDAGGYILITECDNARVPPDNATEVDVGRLAANGEDVEEAPGIPISQLPDWIDGALSRARNPTNVADYYVKRLGASHPDDSLRQLPIDSPCGQDCIKCIDAAATLIEHVRMALGEDVSRSVMLRMTEIARRVVEVYWRG